jgi:hypothetical protein
MITNSNPRGAVSAYYRIPFGTVKAQNQRSHIELAGAETSNARSHAIGDKIHSKPELDGTRNPGRILTPIQR